ncbi:MAG: hypothetical protein ACTSO9_08160 [Candidatus Helarchaeota archaeon]
MAKNSESFRLRPWDRRDKTFVFIGGFIARIFWLILTFLIFANTVDLVDMVEKVSIGINYFLSGINPYGQWYFLHAGEMSIYSWWYIDFFYQYPPLSFIFYLPTALYPNSMYPMDFRPSFFIMNFIIDMYVFYRLLNYDIRWPALIFGGMPLFGMLLDFNNIISAPVLFLTLGMIYYEDPKKCSFFLGLATLTYTYAIVVLAFFLFHYFNKEHLKDFFIGLIIPLAIFGIFLAWNPTALISDLFFSQFGHPPYSFSNTPYGIPALHVCSIPPYVYTFTLPYTPTIYTKSIGLLPWVNGFSGIWWGGFNIIPYMYVCVFGISFYLIYSYWKNHRGDLYYTLGFPFIILGLLVLSSPGGYAHYTIIPLIVAIFGWREREIRKNKLIPNKN